MQESHNSTGDPLKVEMTKPKDCRERQKLLREQNILKQVKISTKAKKVVRCDKLINMTQKSSQQRKMFLILNEALL